MQLCKVQLTDGDIRIGSLVEDHVRFLDVADYAGMQTLSEILHSDDPAALARDLVNDSVQGASLHEVTFLPPVDRQEIWAAGVTYKRSQEARERESVGAARFYALVYSAARPDFFQGNSRACQRPGRPRSRPAR